MSLVNLKTIHSAPSPLVIVPNPTKRYLRKLELSFLYCPDCESQSIYRNGKTTVGNQKYYCKECGFQFVLQYAAVFPKSQRRTIFNTEFNRHTDNWEGARLETLQMMETQVIKVTVEKMLRHTYSGVVTCQQEYDVLLKYSVHEAYVRVMS